MTGSLDERRAAGTATRPAERASAGEPLACRGMAAALGFAHDLFRPPGHAQWEWLTGEETAQRWAALAGLMGFPDWRTAGLPDSAAEYESDFIAAFEAGTPHPPVPLVESHYNQRDPVPGILHENLLFYQGFGLRLRQGCAETPDHLRYQLEFIAYLYELEAEAWAGGHPAATDHPREAPGGADTPRPAVELPGDRLDQIRRARREYVARHLLSWLPRAERSARDAPRPWVHRFLAVTLALVRSVETGLPLE